MKFCSVERESFPDSEFRLNADNGEWYHYPPDDKTGHPMDRTGMRTVPLPEPLDDE